MPIQKIAVLGGGMGSLTSVFQLTNEAIDAPPIALRAALLEAGIEAERLRAMRPGEVWQELSQSISAQASDLAKS